MSQPMNKAHRRDRNVSAAELAADIRRERSLLWKEGLVILIIAAVIALRWWAGGEIA